MNLKLALSLMAALACAGCMNLIVPKTEIKGSIAGQPFSVVSPKDSTLEGLQISASTNGNVTVSINSLTAKMNPDVISMTGAAQVQLIDAISSAIQAAMINGAKTAVAK